MKKSRIEKENIKKLNTYLFNIDKLKLSEHLFRFYYYLSLPIGLLFKPLCLFKYYKENFYPLFKLINRVFTKSIVLTFFAFWYPFIFVVILTNVMLPQSVIFSIGILIPTVTGMQILPTLIVSFKQTSLLKKIGATKIKTWMLTVTFISYFILVSIVSIILNVGLGILMNYKDLAFYSYNFYGKTIAPVVHFGQYIFSLFVGMFVGISIGMVIAGLTKTHSQATLFGLLITLPGGFLSGQFLSFDLLNKVAALKWIGFIFPQKWPTLLAVISTSGGNIFDFTNGGIIINFQNVDIANKIIKSLPRGTIRQEIINEFEAKLTYMVAQKSIIISSYILPWFFVSASIFITVKWFKWQSR